MINTNEENSKIQEESITLAEKIISLSQQIKGPVRFLDILFLDEEANIELIKKSFKKLAVVLHPDKTQSNQKCEQAFVLVKESRDALISNRDILAEAKSLFKMRKIESIPQTIPTHMLDAFFTSPRKPKKPNETSKFNTYLYSTMSEWNTQGYTPYSKYSSYNTSNVFGAVHPTSSCREPTDNVMASFFAHGNHIKKKDPPVKQRRRTCRRTRPTVRKTNVNTTKRNTTFPTYYPIPPVYKSEYIR